MSRKRLEALTPSFRWRRYLAIGGLSGISDVNVTEPEFFKQLETQLKSRPLADWKTYLRWHVAHARAPYLFIQIRSTQFRVLQQVSARRDPAPASLEALRPFHRSRSGRSAGKVFVEKTFGPDVKRRASP